MLLCFQKVFFVAFGFALFALPLLLKERSPYVRLENELQCVVSCCAPAKRAVSKLVTSFVLPMALHMTDIA